jgi:hypothetical protein
VGKYMRRTILALERLTLLVSGRADGYSGPLRVSSVRFREFRKELTRPTDREHIAGVLKWGDSAAGAGIRGGPGKANSYPSLA